MNVLIIGSGGREHALGWKLAQSPLCTSLFILPGNPGTATLGTNLPGKSTDFDNIARICLEQKIGLLVVGPEEPLVLGLRNRLEQDPLLAHLAIVGPGMEGAALEGSKAFSKDFMNRHGIPTAAHQTFSSFEMDAARAYLAKQKPPFVLKADGLAAGKGVVIAQTREEAETALDEMLLQARFGVASNQVVIEQFLRGTELSVFVLTDGENYVLLPTARDHKRALNGGNGPNTGGMGAISPVEDADEDFMEAVRREVIEPTLQGLKQEFIPYRGFLFIGLMNVDGQPFVIEYNCRMGDPETQTVLPLLQGDFMEICLACHYRKLNEVHTAIEPLAAATVVLASGGYPDAYEKGMAISGIEQAQANGALVFHAGTSLNEEGILVSNGGRVLSVTARGNDLEAALQIAYNAISDIHFEGMHYRTDIGKSLIG